MSSMPNEKKNCEHGIGAHGRECILSLGSWNIQII